MCAWKIKENKNTFLINLVNPWRIVLAFELDEDIYEIILCTKFHHNQISFLSSYRVSDWTRRPILM